MFLLQMFSSYCDIIICNILFLVLQPANVNIVTSMIDNSTSIWIFILCDGALQLVFEPRHYQSTMCVDIYNDLYNKELN